MAGVDQHDMLLSPAGVDALRSALTRAGFTSDGIAGRLGAQATGSVARTTTGPPCAPPRTAIRSPP